MSQPAAPNKGRISEDTPISEAEQKLMDECHRVYGARLSQVSENTLLRFVRGYHHEEKAEEKTLEMLGKMLDWREQMEVEKIVKEEYPKEEEFKKVWTSGIHGKGKEGHLVYVDKVGSVDSSSLYKKFTIEEIMVFHVRMMEKITREKDEICAKSGKRRYKQIVILDLKGLGMSHLGSKFTSPMQKFIKIDQEMYPETLHLMFIVNAGLMVKTLWALAAPFLDPITKSNIKFGAEELKNYVDINNIPRYLGGKCRCENCLISPFVEGQEELPKSEEEKKKEKEEEEKKKEEEKKDDQKEEQQPQQPSSGAAANAALRAASANAQAEDDKEVAALLDKSLQLDKSGAPASEAEKPKEEAAKEEAAAPSQ